MEFRGGFPPITLGKATTKPQTLSNNLSGVQYTKKGQTDKISSFITKQPVSRHDALRNIRRL
jgi:hypothetical protein